MEECGEEIDRDRHSVHVSHVVTGDGMCLDDTATSDSKMLQSIQHSI